MLGNNCVRTNTRILKFGDEIRYAVLPEADWRCEVMDGVLAMHNHFCLTVPSCLRQDKFLRACKSIWMGFPKDLAINHIWEIIGNPQKEGKNNH